MLEKSMTLLVGALIIAVIQAEKQRSCFDVAGMTFNIKQRIRIRAYTLLCAAATPTAQA